MQSAIYEWLGRMYVYVSRIFVSIRILDLESFAAAEHVRRRRVNLHWSFIIAHHCLDSTVRTIQLLDIECNLRYKKKLAVMFTIALTQVLISKCLFIYFDSFWRRVGTVADVNVHSNIVEASESL